MAFQTSIIYDTPASFTYDNVKIEVSGAGAKLLPTYNTVATYSFDFTSSVGVTYDTDTAEFSAGSVQQVTQSAANSTYGHDFTASTALYGDGVLTTTLLGSAAITAGKLDCTASTTAGMSIPGANNIPLTQTGCIRFRFTPNYTSSMGQYLFASAAGNNEVYLQHTGSNSLFFTMKNITGVSSISTHLGTWNPTLGQEYIFELNFDLTAGATRLFIDGVQFGSTINTTLTRNASATWYLGVYSSGAGGIDGSFDDFIVFDTVQHTSDHDPTYSLPTNLYDEAVVTLPTHVYSGPGYIKPSASFTTTEVGNVRYTVQGKYWDGGAWATTSNTYATACSKADLLANIATFPQLDLDTCVINVILAAGSTQSSVSQLDLGVAEQYYTTDGVSITHNTIISSDQLTSAAEVITTPSNTGAKYVINTGSDKYWDGSTWSTSIGVTQSNTLSEINANLASLDLGEGTNVKFKVYLVSDDGLSTPTLTSLTVTYEFDSPADTTPAECVVYAHLRNILGDADSARATLVIENLTYFVYNGTHIIRPQVYEATAGADGDVDISVIETETDTHTYKFSVKYFNSEGTQQTFVLGSAEVPNQTSVNLASLTFS